MSFGLRARLSAMMFLQYYVWGIWLPMLAQRLGPNDLNLDKDAIGWIFTVYGFGGSSVPSSWVNSPTVTSRRKECWRWRTCSGASC